MDSTTSKSTDENIVNGSTNGVIANGEHREQQAPTGQKKIVVVGLGMVAIAFMCVAYSLSPEKYICTYMEEAC